MSRKAPVAILLALALGVLACAPGVPVEADLETSPLPEFSVEDLEGNLVTNTNLAGDVVLVNFWATWCGPCKIEMPWFVDFQRKYKDKGFTVLAISLDENGAAPVREFVAELELNFPVVLGDDPLAADFGGVHALPTTFIVDRSGRIVFRHTGLVSKQTYVDEIEALL